MTDRAAQDRARAKDKLVGRTLGEFVLRAAIGEGGYGVVYRAVQPALDRDAVVKVLHARLHSSKTATERFLREAKLASKLDHPYAAHVYAFGAEPDGQLWIAMELVRGTPLDQILRIQGPLAIERFVPLLDRICEVVHTAHEQGIIHRDLKPANVMVLARAGRLLPKLLDFGIAKAVGGEIGTGPTKVDALSDDEAAVAHTLPTPPDEDDPELNLTRRGNVMGSPAYMAPEQWLDAGEVDARTDLYALGILAYEALTGRPPYTGQSITEIAQGHAGGTPPPLGPSFPSRLDAVLRKVLAKRRDDRYPDALAFAAAFREGAGVGAEHTDLPVFDLQNRDSAIAFAPQPIADAVAAFEAARNAHQARDALLQLARTITRYLGLLALACHSRVGGALPSSATETVRGLTRHLLSDADWLQLAGDLTAAWIDRRDAYPIPELVDAFQNDGTLVEHLAAFATLREAEANPETVLEHNVARMSKVLHALTFLHDYPLVAMLPGGIGERWTGVRRARRTTLAIRGGFARLAVGVPALVDRDGIPVLALSPLFQIAPPSVGAPPELFLFEGRDARGAKLVARPSGFEHHDDGIWDWLRIQLKLQLEVDAATEANQQPYRGLSAFSAEDSAMFVGREHLVDAFSNRLRMRALHCIVGRSGAGKSSFVQAGVIPALPAGWRTITMRPGATPIKTLAAVVARLGIVVDGLHAAVKRDRAVLGDRLRADAKERGPILLVIDQFEELFTLCPDDDERELFAAAIVECARSEHDPVRVVLTLRDDFLLRAEQLRALRNVLGQGLQLLSVPGAADLLRIVEEPARRAGFEFDDPELPAEMVHEVADQPGALVLLSFTAAKLWELRDRHFRQLTRKSYQLLGGVGGALARHAETTLEELRPEERRQARDAFRHLVTTENTRAVVERGELRQLLGGDSAETVIEKLVNARLLGASEDDSGRETIEIIHEALLVTWPRLVEWSREDVDGARLREQLRSAAKQWTDRGRADGLLWRGDALADLLRWRERNRTPLTDVETGFADASVASSTRGRRIRRGIIIAAITLLAATAVVMAMLRHRAEAATEESQRRLVASYVAQARTELVSGHRWKALASIVAAQKLGANGPVVETMRGLARRPARMFEYRIAANHGRTWSVRFDTTGKLLATAGEDGAALWDAATGQLRVRLENHGTVRDAVFDAAGSRVATIGFDGWVHVFDVASGRQLHAMNHRGIVRCAAWRADGRWLATAGDNGRIEVWDPASGREQVSVTADSAASACVFGVGLAVGTVSGQVLIVDPDTGSAITLGRHRGWTRSVSFDHSGRHLVTASTDRTVRIWDLESREQVRELQGASDFLIDASYSPDGTHVIATSRDGITRVWDAATGTLDFSLGGHQGSVWHAEYSPDGSRFVTSADDGSARVWEARTGMPLAVLEGHSAAVITARFSPDGTHVVTASYDGTVASWTLETRTGVAAFPSRARCATVRSPDGQRAIVACPDRSTVWDLPAHHMVSTLPGADDAVVAGSAAITTDDRGIHLWALPAATRVADLTASAPIRTMAANRDHFAVGDGTSVVRMVSPVGTVYETIDRTESADWIALADGDRWLSSDTSTLRVFDGGRETGRVAIQPTDMDPGLVLSPAGGWFAVVGFKDAWLGHGSGSPRLVPLVGHQAPIFGASFDDTGGRIVTTSEDGTAIVWNLATLSPVQHLISKSQYLASAVFDDSGELIVAIDGTGMLQLFDISSGDLVGTLDGHVQDPRFLNRSPDHAYVAFSGTGEVVTWYLDRDTEPLATAEHDLACKAPPGLTVGRCLP